jgi:hypothetical protein
MTLARGRHRGALTSRCLQEFFRDAVGGNILLPNTRGHAANFESLVPIVEPGGNRTAKTLRGSADLRTIRPIARDFHAVTRAEPLAGE